MFKINYKFLPEFAIKLAGTTAKILGNNLLNAILFFPVSL